MDAPDARSKTWILSLAEPDEERELDFELDFRLSLSVQQRLNLTLQASRLLAENLARYEGRSYGPGEPTQIIKH